MKQLKDLYLHTAVAFIGLDYMCTPAKREGYEFKLPKYGVELEPRTFSINGLSEVSASDLPNAFFLNSDSYFLTSSERNRLSLSSNKKLSLHESKNPGNGLRSQKVVEGEASHVWRLKRNSDMDKGLEGVVAVCVEENEDIRAGVGQCVVFMGMFYHSALGHLLILSSCFTATKSRVAQYQYPSLWHCHERGSLDISRIGRNEAQSLRYNFDLQEYG